MGDFHPEAHVKGFAGSSIIALLCSNKPATFRFISAIQQMYKVFFNDRTVYFGDNFSRAFVRNKGLFYKYNNIQELNELIELFSKLNQINSLYIFHEDMLMVIEEFKACFHVIEAGGGVVFNRSKEFLAIKRNGIWDLPKGKLEKGEDFQEAALREVEEETGLSGLKLMEPLISTYHTYRLKGEKVLKKTRWFEFEYGGTDLPVLQAKEGITDYRWVIPGNTDFLRQNTYSSILDVLYMRKLL
ncbi:MAG: NUDIX domain-containing protein [Bacteroidia bacterium]|nr:MAG: NUDIX domain-containing protein [Bacteroidia bacterium]